MTKADHTIHVDLTPEDIRIIVQALQHCLATCQTPAVKPDAPCEDCDVAQALKRKIESLAS